jgi:hypothetical protein
MINRVTLLGRLKGAAEFASGSDGGRYAVLSVTTWYRWVERETGRRRSRSDDHTVLTFRRDLFGYLERRAVASATIYVEGALGVVRGAAGERLAAVLVHRDGTIRMVDAAMAGIEDDVGPEQNVV